MRVLEPTPDNMNSINEKVSHDFEWLDALDSVGADNSGNAARRCLATLNSRGDRLNRCDGEGTDQ